MTLWEFINTLVSVYKELNTVEIKCKYRVILDYIRALLKMYTEYYESRAVAPNPASKLRGDSSRNAP